jgi:hypothetical protein
MGIKQRETSGYVNMKVVLRGKFLLRRKGGCKPTCRQTLIIQEIKNRQTKLTLFVLLNSHERHVSTRSRSSSAPS